VNRYLLDTNVVSELRKPRPHGRVVAWLKRQEEEQLFVSAVTIGELQAGIERTRRQDPAKAGDIEFWVGQLAASYQILPMDASCFREWGRIIDRKPDELLEDAMIAATARVHHLIVATRNEGDFKRLDVRIFNRSSIDSRLLTSHKPPFDTRIPFRTTLSVPGMVSPLPSTSMSIAASKCFGFCGIL